MVGREPRIRPAVRAVVVDPEDRILLVRFEFPVGTRWALPGGGIECDEEPAAALRRELLEEAGIEAVIGPHVWDRLHMFPFIDGSFDGQREQIYLVRTPAQQPAPLLDPTQLAAEFVFEVRWWTLPEITASPETFVPARLGAHLGALIAEGPPRVPVDVGV